MLTSTLYALLRMVARKNGVTTPIHIVASRKGNNPNPQRGEQKGSVTL